MAKNSNGHPEDRPNQHGVMVIQTIYLDLGDQLWELNDRPIAGPNHHGMMLIQISIVDLNDRLWPM